MTPADGNSAGTDSTAHMEEQFGAFEQLLSAVEQLFPELETVEAMRPKIDLAKDAFFCLRLGMTYYIEANRVLQTGSWFAASAVASSALEAVLLAKCFSQTDEVKSLVATTYPKLKEKVERDFRTYAASLDLGKLLEIAERLSWFSRAGVPNKFLEVMREYLSEAEIIQMIELFGEELRVGDLCAALLRHYRNLLHPAVCLKEGKQPSHEAGMTATFLSLIAFCSLFEASALASSSL